MLMMVCFGLFIHNFTGNIVKRQMQNRCWGVATVVAAMLEQDIEEYKEFTRTLDTNSQYYKRVKAVMEDIRFANLDNLAFLYVEMRHSDNDMMYIFDAEKEDSDTFAHPGLIEPLTESRRAAYELGEPYVGDFVTTVWGTLLSAYAPVTDPVTGELLGIVGADVSREQYEEALRYEIILIVGSIVILLFVMAIVLIMASRGVLSNFILIISNNENLRSEVESRDKELTSRENLLVSVYKVAGHLLTMGAAEVASGFEAALQKLGESVDADRVYIMPNLEVNGTPCFEVVYDWVRDETIRPRWKKGKLFQYSIFGGWRERLADGHFINISTKELYSMEMEDAREFFKPLSVHSILVLPIHIDGEFWGIAYMANSHRVRYADEAEIYALQSGVCLIALAILRAQMTKQLISAMDDAQAANKAKSSFLANVSHELRTPLNAVLGLTEVELEKDLPADTGRNLEKIYSAGTDLLVLINDILDISKIEAGKTELFEEDYDFPDMINEAININTTHSAASKSVSLIVDVDENMPARLRGDARRVKQILVNLLSNAFKFTKEGEVGLRASCERQGDDAWITYVVSDTGIGIREDDMGKLFMNYSQIETLTNHQISGTGLGLSICRSLAEMMDGAISVESEFGKGSSFIVKIRQGIVDGTSIGTDIARDMKESRYIGSRRNRANVTPVFMPEGRILAVDDVITNLEVAKGLMSRYGITVDFASGGLEAIEMIRDGEKRYDIIFMDHMMPDMDGLEAIGFIRGETGNAYAKTVPIVMLTANVVAGRREIFLRGGANDLLAKPIDIAMLDAVLRKWMPREKQTEIPVEPNGSANSGENALNACLEIPEIDIPAGLRNSGGSAAFYADVLLSFCLDADKKIMEISGAMEKKDLDLYTILVHGLKGTAFSIGADSFAMLAGKMENAGENGDISAINHNTEILLSELRHLTDNIRTALLGCAERMKRQEGTDVQIKTLKKALLQMDVEVVNELMAQYINMPLDLKTRAIISAIDQHILFYEYDEAVKKADLLENVINDSR
jgi:signal transduction histidine kinase/DNA-binding NarL/FixJ family response regulator/HPt (histidine-containing phosphotransfer) domain-containing protein